MTPNFHASTKLFWWTGGFKLVRRSQHNPTTFQGSREVSKDPPLTRLPFLDYCSRWQCCQHVETCKMTRYHFAGAFFDFFGPNVVGGRTTCSDLSWAACQKKRALLGFSIGSIEKVLVYHNTVYHNTGNCSIHSWCPEWFTFMLQHEYANITYNQ